MGIPLGIYPLPEKVTNMPEDDEDEVTDVGRQQNIIRWVLLYVGWQRLALRMLRGETIILIGAVSELGVDSGKDLLRGWGTWREGESIRVVKFGLVQYGVL